MYTKRRGMSQATNILTCAAILCLSAGAMAQTLAQKEAIIHKAFATEGRCLGMASVAAKYAERREEGVSEALLLKVAGDTGTWSDRVYRDIVKLVYTMQLDAQMARQLVYMRCLTGSYNPTVKEMEAEMRKGKK